ncbi:MAG: hypothetical protein PVF83_05720 [Anaerolineales bacterium]
MLSKVWKVDFFLVNILIPLMLLILYFISFEFILIPRLEIPIGVNYVFVNESWNLLSYIFLACLLLFFAIIKTNWGEKLEFNKNIEKISIIDIFLLFLPLMPIVQYIIINQEILSPSGIIEVFLFFVLLSGIYVFTLPIIFNRYLSTRPLMFLGVSFIFTIYSMSSLSVSFKWFESGDLLIQWAFLIVVFLVIFFLYKLSNIKIVGLLIAFVFLTNSTVQFINMYKLNQREPLSDVENKLLLTAEDKELVFTPNIYLLVYDAYVANETMLSHGIDNTAQEEFLVEKGFKLYPHTYSVGASTLETMDRVLNVSTDFYGKMRRATSGDGIVQRVLKGYGYITYGVFPSNYFFRSINPTYDFSYPGQSSSVKILWQAILMGEFRFDAGFINRQRHELYPDMKLDIFKSISGDPVFIYTHSSNPGHAQFSGTCRPDETERFYDRLLTANLEMQDDVDAIIDHDPQSIIIVAGDHGPHLTKNCYRLEEAYDISEISRLDIQDRFGTFLAIRWPDEEYEIFDDITILQDIFPAIFAYLFNDEDILEVKIEPSTISPIVTVRNGIIVGGINDGEPLFLAEE